MIHFFDHYKFRQSFHAVEMCIKCEILYIILTTGRPVGSVSNGCD